MRVTKPTATIILLLFPLFSKVEFAAAVSKGVAIEAVVVSDETDSSEDADDGCLDFVYIDYDNSARIHRSHTWNMDLCLGLGLYLSSCPHAVFCDGSLNPFNNLGGFAAACWGGLPNPPIIYPPGQNGCGNPRCQLIGDIDSKIECICNSHTGNGGLPGLVDNDCPDSGYRDCSDGRSIPCVKP